MSETVSHFGVGRRKFLGSALAIGYASGCAAALAAEGDIAVRKPDVHILQKLLLSQDAELWLNT